ncbi:MAG TPA: HepT-like ribonuclease domain-containing protein [Mucilaginibacter sp.]|jgi:uncharacterized protein with HEPN domain|nr:HepT-like ribonuclease domain-containing protein [Mucilaginibacter sp.]
MMDRKKKYYDDIIFAISSIDEFLGDINLFSQYKVDRKTKSAVERQLAIIGEAIRKIKEIDATELINYHSSIIGFRNILIHSYDSVDDEIVWAIIKRHLIPLKEEVTQKLNDSN